MAEQEEIPPDTAEVSGTDPSPDKGFPTHHLCTGDRMVGTRVVTTVGKKGWPWTALSCSRPPSGVFGHSFAVGHAYKHEG